MAIRVLDAVTVGKIAAGEVVERPSSVVKELMENSIDAGASSITVEIKDGGISYLRVTDNGCGIPFNEARLAFENHATSKLSSAEGLADIRTLGFRGEALPSIAAVSKVVMTTRVSDAEAGARVEIEGGRVLGVTEAGCPEGTTITMRDLFFNLPVRRAFLKKASYEQGLVSDVAQKLALGNPGVSIKLISNGKQLMRSVGDGQLRNAALGVYGREYALALREIDAFEGALAIKGLIGVGEQARPTRDRQCFFINGRLIRCQMLSQALEEACRGRVTAGMYPTCALALSMPPEAVDVNVHPGKLEVRFRDDAAFRLTAISILSNAFAGERMLDAAALKQPDKPIIENEVERVIPPQAGAAPNIYPVKAGGDVRESAGAPLNEMLTPRALPEIPNIPDDMISQTPPGGGMELAEQTKLDILDEYMDFKLIGTLFQTYILVEYADKLLMIDQHAAHERLNYENFARRLSEGALAQQLLIPYIVRVSKREARILTDNAELLRESGYEIEPFGETDVQVRAVPFQMGQSDTRMLFTELIDSLELLKTAERDKRLSGIIQASCKHAVKAGDKLTEGEIKSLIDAMLASGAPPACPHGRPVMRVLSKREIEIMFKRIQ